MVSSLSQKFSDTDPRLRLLNPEAAVFRVELEPSGEKGKEIRGVFAILPGDHPNFHRIVTISYSNFWNRAIRKIVRKSYPEAMPVFFKQNEIRDVLRKFESTLGPRSRIRVSEVTMKRKSGRDSTISKRFETDRLWTELSIEQVFELARERNQWFTSIQIQIQQIPERSTQFRTIATGRIYKYGELNYDYLHREVNLSLVSNLEGYASDRLTLLQGRGIRDRGYRHGLPIEIMYDRNIFEKKEEIQRFASVISDYPNSTKAVFHSNPYYHASVADFLDGSSFEVWILSPQRVLIVPQAKASERAFERLIGHIFFEFREGEINEYSR